MPAWPLFLIAFLLAAARRRGRSTGGFRSRAQWRLFWANPRLRKYARKKAHKTVGGKVVRYRRLPDRLHAKKRYR